MVIAITGATLGQVSLLEIDACANQSVVGIIGNADFPYTFIYPFMLANINKLTSHATGGAQQHINKQNIENFNLPSYPADVMDNYNTIVLPIFEKIRCNCFESRYLTNIRNTLLPKLISGELRIKDAEKIIGGIT